MPKYTAGLSSDTIAAIATPPGLGAIGIVRLSGPDSQAILKKIFMPKSDYPLPPHVLRQGTLAWQNQLIDQPLAVYNPAPHSYTGEDSAEIHCHGGALILATALQAVLEAGARLANPGEFTQRAFLNGRLDLSQSEAIIDLLTAKSSQALNLANQQLAGALKAKVQPLADELKIILANLALLADFPEEAAQTNFDTNTLKHKIKALKTDLTALLQGGLFGQVYRDGVNVVLVGATNAGKSSIFNALIAKDKAIVTDIPGTTRDTLDATIIYQNLPINLFDTAGLRATQDIIENIGIGRTKAAVFAADIVILVTDGQSAEDLPPETKSKLSFVVLNKADIVDIAAETAKLQTRFPGLEILIVSAKEAQGLDLIKEQILKIVKSGQVVPDQEIWLSNARQQAVIQKTIQALDNALVVAEELEDLDLASIDLNQAWHTLGGLYGETTDEAIIDTIFSQFCLGK